MSGAEIEKLPDPDLFRDAHFLWQHGTWTADSLDNADELLVALVQKFANAHVGRE